MDKECEYTLQIYLHIQIAKNRWKNKVKPLCRQSKKCTLKQQYETIFDYQINKSSVVVLLYNDNTQH